MNHIEGRRRLGLRRMFGHRTMNPGQDITTAITMVLMEERRLPSDLGQVSTLNWVNTTIPFRLRPHNLLQDQRMMNRFRIYNRKASTADRSLLLGHTLKLLKLLPQVNTPNQARRLNRFNTPNPLRPLTLLQNQRTTKLFRRYHRRAIVPLRSRVQG